MDDFEVVHIGTEKGQGGGPLSHLIRIDRDNYNATLD